MDDTFLGLHEELATNIAIGLGTAVVAVGATMLYNSSGTNEAPADLPPSPTPQALPTPKALGDRLLAAISVMTTAAQRLPAETRGAWQSDEPSYIESTIYGVYARVRNVETLSNADAAQIDASTIQIEQAADDYASFCADLISNLAKICEHRKIYRDHIAPLQGSFDTISQHLERGPGAQTAAQVQQLCAAYLEQLRQSTVQTSAQLNALMLANKGRAEKLVSGYFATGRLKINKWRTGYATRFDPKAREFGAEWTLKAPDRDLRDIATNWVFHTHAKCDQAMNVTISRQHGASHIKPLAALHGANSLNFVHEAEFSRAETEAQSAFAKWAYRDGFATLMNANKR